MPDMSTHQALFRSGKHQVTVCFGAWLGIVVFEAAVTVTPMTTTKALTIAPVSGEVASVRRGFRVVVEDSDGNYKGETSVRFSGAISASNLPIRELTFGELPIQIGDVVKVYNVPILTDLLVEDNAAFAPDGMPYVAQNHIVAPLAASGGAFMGDVDDGEDYATFTLSGVGARAIDANSTGALLFETILPEGVSFAPDSTATDISPVVRASVGYHLIERVVTDEDNGTSWTQLIPVQVYDPSARPFTVIGEVSLTASEQGEWTLEGLTLDGVVTEADLPNRSMCCVYVRERIGATRGSYGNREPSRSHMKMVGYLVRDEAALNTSGSRSVQFGMISPLARLGELPGFSKVMEKASSGFNWSKIKSLTVLRGILLLVRYYTNLNTLYDFLIADAFQDYDYPAFYLTKNTPRLQVEELTAGVDARLTCDRTGSFFIGTTQSLVALDARDTLPTTLTLSRADLAGSLDSDLVRFSREHFDALEVIEMRGFTAGDNAAPIFSRWSGTPGRGSEVDARDKLIAASQSDLNERAGRHGAQRNHIFMDADGHTTRGEEGELSLPGSYDVIDPAYQEWLLLALDTSSNGRGIDLSQTRKVATGVNVTYGAGTAEVRVNWRSETHALRGQTHIPKPDDPLILPDFNLPNFNWSLDPLPPPSLIPPWNNHVPVRMWGGWYNTTPNIQRSISIDYGIKQVLYDGLGDMGMTGRTLWGLTDPHVWEQKFVMNTDGLWRIPDLWASSPVAQQVCDPSDIFDDPDAVPFYFTMTHNDRKGWICAISGMNVVSVSFDYGRTWTQTTIDGNPPVYGTDRDPFAQDGAGGGFALRISGWNSRNKGVVYALRQIAGHPDATARLYRSDDWGRTWATHSTFKPSAWFVAWDNYMRLDIPYMRTPNTPNREGNNQVMYCTVGSGGNVTFLYKSIDGGHRWTLIQDLYPTGSSARFANNPITSFTHDGQIMAFAAQAAGVSGKNVQIRSTLDGGTTFTQIRNRVYGANATSINGFSSNENFLVAFAPSGAPVAPPHTPLQVEFTDDRGLNWYPIQPPDWGTNGCAFFEGDLTGIAP